MLRCEGAFTVAALAHTEHAEIPLNPLLSPSLPPSTPLPSLNPSSPPVHGRPGFNRLRAVARRARRWCHWRKPLRGRPKRLPRLLFQPVTRPRQAPSNWPNTLAHPKPPSPSLPHLPFVTLVVPPSRPSSFPHLPRSFEYPSTLSLQSQLQHLLLIHSIPSDRAPQSAPCSRAPEPASRSPQAPSRACP